jgi:hypothetical protein
LSHAVVVANTPDEEYAEIGQEPMVAATATIDSAGMDMRGGDLFEDAVSLAFDREDLPKIALAVLEEFESEENDVHAAGLALAYGAYGDVEHLLREAYINLRAVAMVRKVKEVEAAA